MEKADNTYMENNYSAQMSCHEWQLTISKVGNVLYFLAAMTTYLTLIALLFYCVASLFFFVLTPFFQVFLIKRYSCIILFFFNLCFV